MKAIKFNLGALLALFIALPLAAQQFAPVSITAGNTNLNGMNGHSNAIAAASAVTYINATSGGLIPLTKYDGTSIQMTAKLMGSGSSAITAMFDASNDGTNWIKGYTYVTATANGTTAVNSGTNLSLINWGYLRLNYVTNASNEVLTNLCITYTLKPRRNG